MKLVIAVVKDDDTFALLDGLTQRRIGATKLASTGGFLREGNTTLLIGVEDDQVDDVLELIRRVCRHRTKVAPQFTPEQGQMLPPAMPINVETGGAIVWVAPVERFVHF